MIPQIVIESATSHVVRHERQHEMSECCCHKGLEKAAHSLAVVLDHSWPPQARGCMVALALLILLPAPVLQ